MPLSHDNIESKCSPITLLFLVLGMKSFFSFWCILYILYTHINKIKLLFLQLFFFSMFFCFLWPFVFWLFGFLFIPWGHSLESL